MAYIPPHKRPDPSISASTNIQKGLRLDYSPFSVRRFLVVPESSSRLLEFVPFEGKPVFSHLKGSSLYAIKRESAVHEGDIFPPTLHFHLVAKILFVCILTDLGIWRCWLELFNGKLSRRQTRGRIGRALTSRIPVKQFLSYGVMPSCYANGSAEFSSLGNQEGNEFAICHSIVEALRDDLASIIQKLKSTHVDNPAPTNVLLSIGRILFAASDGRSFDWEEPYTSRYVEEQINIKSGKWKKIRTTFYDPQPSNLFTFFKETAEQDGLQISTKERYFIVAEERSDLESLLCNVLLVDGHCRLDPACSSSGRFEFDHMFLSKTFSFKGPTFKGRLESIPVHGMDYVRIKPILLKEYLKGHVECTMDELMSSIEQALIRLWKCCS